MPNINRAPRNDKRPHIDYSDAKIQFKKEMARQGLIVEDFQPDGQTHRCPVNGKKTSSRDGAYWYHANHSGIPYGGYQNHTDGTGWHDWHYKPAKMTPEQQRHYDKHHAEMKKAQAVENHNRAELRKQSISGARRMRNGSSAANDDYPYLKRKNVKAHGVRQCGSWLLVPVWNDDERLQSLHIIRAIGSKKTFLKGTQAGGGHFLIGEPSDTICIAEGYATAASIHEATGHCCYVAFSAGNLMHVAKLVRERHPNLRIIVCADDDWNTDNNPGLAAAKEAARAVNGMAAVPIFTNKRADKHTDFNDLMLPSGADAVRRDITNAAYVKDEGSKMTRAQKQRLVEPADSTDIDARIILPHDDPTTCAEEFLKLDFTTPDGGSCLYYYRGSFYRWTGTQYVETDAKDVRSRLYAFLKTALTIRRGKITPEPFKPTQAKVNSILDALESGVFQSRENDAPFWIKAPAGSTGTDNLIACRNGVLDVATSRLHPHSPDLFNVNCLPFDYDPDPPRYPKLWMQFLRQLFPGDGDGRMARRALQEMFGLLLTADTRYEKIFMIVGPKRSGKGTIARVLTGLLGKDSIAGPTLASLASHFGLSSLIDKRAAIITDARLGPQTNADVVAERLLSISGEDSLDVDRKYRDVWTGRLKVRFLILTNELPRITDASGALASRFVVLILTESHYGKEDLELTDKLLTELSGILNWSLAGLQRLRDYGCFEMPKSSITAIRQLEDLASPVRAFLRDWCIIGPKHKIATKVFYDAYARWAALEGDKAGSAALFGRNLHATLPQIQIRRSGDDRFYHGVSLSDYGSEQHDIETEKKNAKSKMR